MRSRVGNKRRAWGVGLVTAGTLQLRFHWATQAAAGGSPGSDYAFTVGIIDTSTIAGGRPHSGLMALALHAGIGMAQPGTWRVYSTQNVAAECMRITARWIKWYI